MRPIDTLRPPFVKAVVPRLGRSTSTAPYGWPWDGDFRAERLCLLVTGAQYGLVAVSDHSESVLGGIVGVARRVREAGGLVCFVRHGAAGSTRPLLPSTGSVDWQLRLDPEPEDVVVDAGGWDGFHDGPLDRSLRSRGRDLVAVCGFAQEASVDGTCRSANDRGYECLTLTDLVAPLDADTGRHALSSVTMSGGIFGAIGPSSALTELIDGELADRDATTPERPAPDLDRTEETT